MSTDENTDKFSDPFDEPTFDPTFEETSSESFDIENEDLQSEEVVQDNILGNKQLSPEEAAREAVKKIRDNCGLSGLTNVIVGCVVGSGFGFIQGVAFNYQNFGLRGYTRSILQSSLSNSLSFGAWLGSYEYTKCSIAKLRRKKDVLNTFAGGFAAGALTSLRTRAPAVIAMNGFLSGAVMAMFEIVNLGQ